MKKSHSLEKSVLWSGIIFGLVLSSGITTKDAHALAKKKESVTTSETIPTADTTTTATNTVVITEQQTSVDVVPVLTEPIVIDPIKRQQGLQLGLRNGSLIAKRIKDRTIGIQGCAALEQYQQGLLQVSRSVQAPAVDDSNDSDIAVGFFEGYLSAIKRAISSSRQECSLSSFEQGNLVGELHGSLICKISHVNVNALSVIEISPIHEGWSGGQPQVIEQCEQSAELVLKSCSQDLGSVENTLTLAIELSCQS